jgi:Ca2+-binding RTX toxin-like protein
LYGGRGNDLLLGGPKSASRFARSGGDKVMSGGPGDDTLLGGFGTDTLAGGSGDDFLADSSPLGDARLDVLAGGSGTTRLALSTSRPLETSLLVAPVEIPRKLTTRT